METGNGDFLTSLGKFLGSGYGPDFTTISISEGVSFSYIQLFVHSGVFLLKVVCLLS